jgi:hypothetical protein
VDVERAKNVVERLGAKADLDGFDSLSEEEKTILAPYWARGVIGNGGFRYFFEGKHDLTDVARRMKALQFDAAAAACEKVARQVFPRGLAPADDAEREALLAKVDWKRFAGEEDVIFDLGWQELLEAVAGYIDRHLDAFTH